MEKPILLIDTMHPLFSELLEKAGFTIVDGTSFNREKIIGELHKFDGVAIRSRIVFDKECIDHAHHLKFIARAGAGMESIDVDYAESKSILCLNSPEGNRDALAEHAVGMLLSLLNRLNIADREIRKGMWLREKNRGFELGGKTVGIIGYGNMGSAFAKRLKGFGVDVIAYDKYKENFTDEFAREVSMDAIFKESDILSLHLPLTPETHYLLNDTFVQSFHKPFYLINTARGKIVDTECLVKNLKSGKILGAALDVLEYESHSFENMLSLQSNMPLPLQYLMESDQVVLSPHIAGWSFESNEKIAGVLVGKILGVYAKGG
jgi:D-3-phosphoglycerate dehydrogenase